MLRRLPLAASCLVVLSMPGPLEAQTSAPGAPSRIEAARFRWGPLGLSPRIQVNNVGVDTNVFNAAGEPQRDVTATVSPGADSWLRVGRAQLSLSTTLDWAYFRRATEQRWLGVTQEGRFDLLFNRLHPYVSGAYASTRQRPNLEIDVRVRQKQQRLGVGTALRVGSRLTFDVTAAQSRVDFGDTAFGQAEIAAALNRESRAASLSARVVLTPLTTFVVQSSVVQDRFDASSLRDSDSVLVVPGLEFQPRALIAGRVSVGFRQFDVLDPTVPDYQGAVAAVEVSYIAREMTRFEVAMARDVDYSVEELQPYSVVTNAGLTVTQVIGFNWYVLGRASRARLDYRSLPGQSADAARRDHVTLVGAGVARRIGTDLRVGFDVDRVSRDSPIAGRDYDGYRLGGSISYGIN